MPAVSNAVLCATLSQVANLEARIDELYQRPLDEFTSARNALAKTLSGEAKRQVAALKKPTSALWAVNQLYWRLPATYKALVDASEKLRAAHRTVLEGKKSDIRKAERLHHHTLERAVTETSNLVVDGAGTPSEAMVATVRRVLAGLPGADRAGRFTQEPPPAGFSLLEGVAIKAQPAHKSVARDRHAEARTQRKVAEDERRRHKAEQLERKAEAARRSQEAQAQRALDRARRTELRAAERRKAAEERLAALARK